MSEETKTNIVPAEEGEPLGLNPKEELESKTARLLAIILVTVLVVAFVVHYVVIALMGVYHPDGVQNLIQAFSIAFPVFSGLAGTAVGFYLKERK